MRAAFLPIAILAALAAPVSAQSSGDVPIPDHDVDSACRRTMTTPLTVSACVREAQYAYDRLTLIWPRLSPEGREAAISAAERQKRFGAYQFYQMLGRFAEREVVLEQQGRDRVDPPRFQRR